MIFQNRNHFKGPILSGLFRPKINEGQTLRKVKIFYRMIYIRTKLIHDKFRVNPSYLKLIHDS